MLKRAESTALTLSQRDKLPAILIRIPVPHSNAFRPGVLHRTNFKTDIFFYVADELGDNSHRYGAESDLVLREICASWAWWYGSPRRTEISLLVFGLAIRYPISA